MEIERKWVLDAAPDGLAEHRSQRFEQGYLAIDPAGAEVRVRRKDGATSVMTVKTGIGMVRGEEEWEIANFDAPEWLGRDVTEDTRYGNRVLAIEGIPT